jgi:hypothetical protein
MGDHLSGLLGQALMKGDQLSGLLGQDLMIEQMNRKTKLLIYKIMGSGQFVVGRWMEQNGTKNEQGRKL